jgi:hypothetical protein
MKNRFNFFARRVHTRFNKLQEIHLSVYETDLAHSLSEICHVWIDRKNDIREDCKIFCVPIDAINAEEWDTKGIEYLNRRLTAKKEHGWHRSNSGLYEKDGKLFVYIPDDFEGEYDEHIQIPFITLEQWNELEEKRDKPFYIFVAILGTKAGKKAIPLNQAGEGDYIDNNWVEYDFPNSNGFEVNIKFLVK